MWMAPAAPERLMAMDGRKRAKTGHAGAETSGGEGTSTSRKKSVRFGNVEEDDTKVTR